MFYYILFKKSLNRAYTKFKLNFFFYKNALSLKFSHTSFIHLFINIYKQLSVRFFKLPADKSQTRTFYFLQFKYIIFILNYFKFLLKKKIHFLFINITINKKFINKNKQNKNLDFLHISLKNNINNLFNNIEGSVDSVFKKFVFLGIALGLVN